MDATIAASPVVVDRYSQIKHFLQVSLKNKSDNYKDEAKLGEEQLALIDWTNCTLTCVNISVSVECIILLCNCKL